MSNDITMCENPEECPFKDRCQRWQLNTTTALDKSQWDTGTAWDEAPLKPFYRPGEKCGHFMSAYPYRAEVRPCVGSDIMDDPT